MADQVALGDIFLFVVMPFKWEDMPFHHIIDRISAVTAMDSTWTRIRTYLRTNKPEIFKDLNPAATESALTTVENTLGRSLPPQLRRLYEVNNGQAGKNTGIFPGEFSGVRFLPVEEIVPTRQRLLADEDIDVFDAQLVPFAYDGAYDLYGVDPGTGSVQYLLVGGPDIFLPVCWQTRKEQAAPSLEEFLKEILVRFTQTKDLDSYFISRLDPSVAEAERARAARELGDLKGERVLPTLIRVIREDPSDRVRFIAVMALRYHIDARAVGVLKLTLQDDPDKGVRTEAARQLVHQAPNDIVPTLSEALILEDDFWVRFEIAHLLGKLSKRISFDADMILPRIRDDLKNLDENMDVLRFKLALALLRLEGEGQSASAVLDQMKAKGTLTPHQLKKISQKPESRGA